MAVCPKCQYSYCGVHNKVCPSCKFTDELMSKTKITASDLPTGCSLCEGTKNLTVREKGLIWSLVQSEILSADGRDRAEDSRDYRLIKEKIGDGGCNLNLVRSE